ncbi:sugar phosphate isomerase/epimerase family protein [Cecembia rubra]|uniref:Sugar phosphate isomerase/epimerase n=1 Tax=Cecembia rubra TaxID=1485585 RepID=A0A2P8E6H0_9BACT|nr:TIM barrel protein [Cecembia rubra]PSL05064.1 sugar phosphate isomerase/epimerase [Cecembia rubra]
MNRRKFIQTSSAILASSITMGHVPVLKNVSKLRLGGPLYKKFLSPEEWAQIVKGYGYRAAYCPVGLNASREDIRSYELAAKKHDILIAEVGAWSNPISPDSKTAAEAFEKCTRSLQLADEIGANCCVNIAGSKNMENWAGPHKDNFSDETFEQIIETTRRIIDEVQPTRTYFTLEAMPWVFPESPDSYLKLIKAIDRKGFGVHLDPVNMVVSPAIFFKNGEMIKECFKKLGPYIKSCHAKDLVLKENTYMPQFEEVIPGRGLMDYTDFLTELRNYPEIPLMMEHLNNEEEYKEGTTYIQMVHQKIKDT